jgi:hypothetical protein
MRWPTSLIASTIQQHFNTVVSECIIVDPISSITSLMPAYNLSVVMMIQPDTPQFTRFIAHGIGGVELGRRCITCSDHTTGMAYIIRLPLSIDLNKVTIAGNCITISVTCAVVGMTQGMWSCYVQTVLDMLSIYRTESGPVLRLLGYK